MCTYAILCQGYALLKDVYQYTGFIPASVFQLSMWLSLLLSALQIFHRQSVSGHCQR